MKPEKYSEENTKLLLETVWYDMLSGDFYWREGRPLNHFQGTKGRNIWLGRFAGKRIDGVHRTNKKTPYPCVRVGKYLYLLHVVAWRILYGDWPKDQIDHIDRNGGNNVATNLRLADYYIQAQNKNLYSNNKIGIAGIHTSKTRPDLWKVLYSNNYLGRTPDFFEACCWRKREELKYEPV